MTVSKVSYLFYIIIESPKGVKVEKLITSSTKFTLYDFSGQDAYGKWQVSIRTQGTKDVVAMATAILKVNYTY